MDPIFCPEFFEAIKQAHREVLQEIEPPEIPEPLMRNATEAAACLHISIPTFIKNKKLGLISGPMFGKRMLFSPEDIKRAAVNLAQVKGKWELKGRSE